MFSSKFYFNISIIYNNISEVKIDINVFKNYFIIIYDNLHCSSAELRRIIGVEQKKNVPIGTSELSHAYLRLPIIALKIT